MRARKPKLSFNETPAVFPDDQEQQRENRRKRLSWLISLLAVLGLAILFVKTRNAPPPTASETLSQSGNSPDAIVEKVHLVSTLQGVKRWELYSDSARMYQNQKQAYADNIFIQYYKNNKVVSTLNADKAVIDTETNATEVEGHVELVVENGSKLETDRLHWDPKSDQIQTNERVHIYKGLDEITAVGLVADTQLNNIKFVRDVHTQLRDTKEIENYGKTKKF